MAVNTTDWSQPTTTVGTATIYDSATAYDTSAYYDGLVTISNTQLDSTNWSASSVNSTNWAIGCFAGIIVSLAFLLAGGVAL